jgi:NAD(P)H-dependent flavin oxidoreductase YrpB (nitropropane dioxygenase family)
MYDKHQKNFACQYPVICAGMNAVSNVKLALAVNAAGCYPSLVAFNYIDMNTKRVDSDMLEKHLAYYKEKTGSSNFILGVGTVLLTEREDVVKVINNIKPRYLEIFDTDYLTNPKFIANAKAFRENGINLLSKMLSAEEPIQLLKEYPEVMSYIDGVTIKGSKAAGRVAEIPADLNENIRAMRDAAPNWIIIAQGGVHDSSGIKECLDAGADMVSMGTIFALSEEAAISVETKNKMVQASYADTTKIGTANQNGLVFSKVEQDVENNTIGLKKGIMTGKEGHVFAGAAIDHVSEIRPVAKIVEQLVSGL